MLRSDFAADQRVNVIGAVPKNAHLLMERIRRGGKFRLVRP